MAEEMPKNTSEETDEPLYAKTYFFIKGYAYAKNLNSTLKALSLARHIHSGQYRKGTVRCGNEVRRIPYLVHVLKVCSTLISLDLPVDNREEDILLASALLHDSLEDCPDFFPKGGGEELVTELGFPEKVYETVKLLTKRSGASKEELDKYFSGIRSSRTAILVKLADRGHNVETLYVMKPEKIHEYVEETRTYVIPLLGYARITYPELANAWTILKSKIASLTEASENFVEQYEQTIRDQAEEIRSLKSRLKAVENAS